MADRNQLQANKVRFISLRVWLIRKLARLCIEIDNDIFLDLCEHMVRELSA